MKALDLSYEEYIAINGGEHCGICGAPPVPGRKLDRDHEHVGDGVARGLLCKKCNRSLVKTRYGLEMTPAWLRAAADYLERTMPPVAGLPVQP